MKSSVVLHLRLFIKSSRYPRMLVVVSSTSASAQLARPCRFIKIVPNCEIQATICVIFTYTGQSWHRWLGRPSAITDVDGLYLGPRTFLLTPFSPFFVPFCHIIETSSLTDLKLREDFVTFLNGCRKFSDTIEKLYLHTQIMVDIAGLYLEAKPGQQDGLAMTSIGNEFKMYLNQLDHTMA